MRAESRGRRRDGRSVSQEFVLATTASKGRGQEIRFPKVKHDKKIDEIRSV